MLVMILFAMIMFCAEAYSYGISEFGEHDLDSLDDLDSTAGRSVMILVLAVAPRYFVPRADTSPAQLQENGWIPAVPKIRSPSYHTMLAEMTKTRFNSSVWPGQEPFPASGQVSDLPVPTQFSVLRI